jgi:hypothetical protein
MIGESGCSFLKLVENEKLSVAPHPRLSNTLLYSPVTSWPALDSLEEWERVQ